MKTEIKYKHTVYKIQTYSNSFGDQEIVVKIAEDVVLQDTRDEGSWVTDWRQYIVAHFACN